MGANKSANPHATHRVLTCQMFGGLTALGGVGATGTSPHKHRPLCGRDRPHSHMTHAARVFATAINGSKQRAITVSMSSRSSSDWLGPSSAIHRSKLVREA